MKQMAVVTILLALLIGTSASADERRERTKLSGRWTLQSAADNSPISGWTFVGKGDSLRVTEREGEKTIANFECTTEGTPCEVKTNGKKTMVSLWFNGSKLVEMETRGSDVLKRRFGVMGTGDLMEMEVIPLIPSGKSETFQFKRVPLSAQNR